MSVKVDYADQLPNAPECDALGVQVLNDYVIIAHLDKKGEPTLWSIHDPKQALKIAEQIARSGYAAMIKDDVHGLTSAQVERLRAKLVISIEHLLKSEIINGNLDKPRLTAEKCVSLMLTEVV